MYEEPEDLLTWETSTTLQDATLLLAFEGWMDGGEVSTGTVGRLVRLLNARPLAEIDPELFYIYNFPGPMEVAELFRPHIAIRGGLLRSVEMPSARFYVDEATNLAFFVAKEPHLRWRLFKDCIFHLAESLNVTRILFVGSFGGTVPHTREPRLYMTYSDKALRSEMENYGVSRTGYEGPGSFSTYLMSEVGAAGLQMISLVAEIPGYLQGKNPTSILAVTRRLAALLELSLELDELRSASTDWEMQVSAALEQDEELSQTVRQLEADYDDQLLNEADIE